jgi:hypothetical protein
MMPSPRPQRHDCGHRYNSGIGRYVSRLGVRSPASISRYSRTLTPINQAARQTRRPSRFRSRSIIEGNAASVATDRAYRGGTASQMSAQAGVRCASDQTDHAATPAAAKTTTRIAKTIHCLMQPTSTPRPIRGPTRPRLGGFAPPRTGLRSEQAPRTRRDRGPRQRLRP